MDRVFSISRVVGGQNIIGGIIAIPMIGAQYTMNGIPMQ
jgi:hypothetical protein